MKLNGPSFDWRIWLWGLQWSICNIWFGGAMCNVYKALRLAERTVQSIQGTLTSRVDGAIYTRSFYWQSGRWNLYKALQLVERMMRPIQGALVGRSDGVISTRCPDWQSKQCVLYKVLRLEERTFPYVQGAPWADSDLVTLEVGSGTLAKWFKLRFWLYKTEMNWTTNKGWELMRL